MKTAVLFFVCLLSCFCIKSKAQGTFAGCLVAGEQRIYSVDGGGSVYDPRFFTDLSPNYCSWSPNSGTTCDVCSGALNGGGNCPGHSYKAQGVQGIFTMLACPMGNYFFPFALTLAAMGIISVLKRKILLAE